MTIKNPKAKGSRNERRSLAWLEARGYRCTKSGGSLGEWDIIAIGPHDIQLVQVKSNTWPSPKERMALRDFPIPVLYFLREGIAYSGIRKIMHRWNDRAQEPLVREVWEMS